MNRIESDIRQTLRDWVLQHAHKSPNNGLQDDTPILEQRIITSLQVMELILFIEKSSGRSVTLTQLKPCSFRSIDHIYKAFFAETADDHAAA